MKKLILIILLITTLTLTACGVSLNAAETTSSNISTSELPLQTELLLGSLKLDDSEQPITATQAAELLPLWQVYEELLTSDTAAQEEINALVNQIQETMTPAQLQAIEAMNLTPDDLALAMQGQASIPGTAQSNASTTMASAPQGGPARDMPAEGMPVGDGGMDTEQVPSSAPVSGSQAPQTQSAMAFPTALIHTLVQLLESKIA